MTESTSTETTQRYRPSWDQLMLFGSEFGKAARARGAPRRQSVVPAWGAPRSGLPGGAMIAASVGPPAMSQACCSWVECVTPGLEEGRRGLYRQTCRRLGGPARGGLGRSRTVAA